MEKRIAVMVEKYFASLSDEQLGKLMKEYISETNWNSWDGFRKREIRGALTVLRDVMIYGQNMTP